MIENRRLLFPYAAPYLAYVLIASLLGELVSPEINYILRILAAAGLLFWARHWYIPIADAKSTLHSVVTGTIFGLAGCLLWVLLLTPFTGQNPAAPWSTPGVFLRLIAAGFLVPVFEELMIRGYAFRLAYQWAECRKQNIPDPLHVVLHERSINDVQPGQWSYPAVIISTFVFMIGHSIAEWPASIAYGLLMVMLLIRQKNLLACIVAHSVTNISLALYIYLTDSWYLW